MTDTTVRFNEMIAALKEKGFRLTPQRMALVHLIASSEGHPSAAQLYERIQHQFPTMSQATVYKTLVLLKEMGQVLEIDMHDDSHYDGNRIEPHPHLICVKCGKIMDGEADFLQSEIRKLETATGYTILHSQVSFFGLCPDCKEKDV
jgi:Fur family peroxide stress response transcriptional regulator